MEKSQTLTDEKFMRRCIQLAACGRNLSRPNPMVGCVIVAGGRILGEGYHVRCGEGHAEVNAFASVSADDEKLLPEATLYVSLEPCSHHGKTPPCSDLIVRKGVRRVVVGCIDPFAEVQGRGVKRLRDAGIEVVVGVLEEECRHLNRRFFTFHEKNRPYIILKWAQTADGYLDDCGKPLAISTPFTKMLVHKLRAEEDAIVVGRVTWEREHPQLNVREWAGKNPVRFVIRGAGKPLPPPSPKGEGAMMEAENECRTIEELFERCREWQLQSLIVEGGRETLQSFLDKNLWDEIRVEKAPNSQLSTLNSQPSTPSPEIPETATAFRREQFDGNTIVYYFF